MKIHHSRLLLAALGSVLMAHATTTQAHERRFVYSYETTTMPKGEWEIEQWATWKSYDFRDRFEFRTELEYGLTDDLTIAAYLSDWRIDNYEGERGTEAEWRTAGIEALYQLTDPNTSWLGTALYGETLIGPEKFELEGKLLLQKNFGPLALVYNFVVESEWEGSDYDELKGVIEHTFGLSYQINPSLFIGLEALEEVELEDWSDAGDHVFYVGPNLSIRKNNFSVTFAGLFQATGIDGEPDAQVRMIAAYSF